MTSDDINGIVNCIESVFKETSTNTFGYKNDKVDDKYNNLNPWFNRACIQARNIHHNTRKMYNKHKAIYYKKILKIVSKNYKQTLNKENKKFQTERIQKLRRLKNSNPKEYWKIINSDKTRKTKCASLDDFYHFYQAANGKHETESEEDKQNLGENNTNCAEMKTIIDYEVNKKNNGKWNHYSDKTVAKQ